MRFLLLGGVGYLGGRLSSYLKQQGHYVRVSTRRTLESVPPWLKADDVVQADPHVPDTLQGIFDTIDIAIDLAAPDEVQSAKEPADALKAGADGTWAILQRLSLNSKPVAFIYLSTFHVYGTNAAGVVTESTVPAPTHPYALGKHLGESVVQAFRKQKHIQALCVRLSNAFGAPAGIEVPRWTLVFNDFCRQAIEQKKLVLKSSGTQRRNFIPIGDVVKALEFLSLQRARWPEDGFIHLGSETQWSIREAADRVATVAKDLMGSLPEIVIPSDAPVESSDGFTFSVDRLKSLGFSWRASWDDEIRDTLKLCRK